MEVFVEKLKGIQAMYSKQRVFHIFGSSILFVYDAAALLGAGVRGDLERAVVVKMIDFAHVHPAHGEADVNYNTGLRSLIEVMERAAAL